MTLERAAEYPVLTVASGPTNSLRGGALLSGRADAIVIDVGGTTADLGRHFPASPANPASRSRSAESHQLPHARSGVGRSWGWHHCAPGGDGLAIGPDSVGYEITRQALCFGGEVLTLTDVAINDGHPLDDAEAIAGA